MKRLILIIGFIVLTGAIFAQSWGASDVGYIQTYPQYEIIQHNHPNAVNTVRYNDTTNVNYQKCLKYLTGDNFYSFLRNKKLFMLSYDACSTCYKDPAVGNPITRGLYLFRLDVTGWTKVSDTIQTDYYKLLSDKPEPIWSKFCYIPPSKKISPKIKDGGVTISPDG